MPAAEIFSTVAKSYHGPQSEQIQNLVTFSGGASVSRNERHYAFRMRLPGLRTFRFVLTL